MSFEFNVSGKGGSTIPPLEGGIHPAVLVRMIDLGTHTEDFKGKPRKARKVVFSWEVIGETVKLIIDDKEVTKPRVLSKTYTASVHEKSTLRKELESWRGVPFTKEEAEKFNLGVLLGKSCQLSVTVTEEGMNKIGAIVPTLKDPATGKKLVYTPTEKLVGWTIGMPLPEGGFPKWIADQIAESEEGKKIGFKADTTASPSASEIAKAEVVEEEIPF